MNIDNLKHMYNELLEREKKAEVCLNAATDEQFEKWYPEFNKIVVELSYLMFEYEKLTSMEMTKKEILEGFEVN